MKFGEILLGGLEGDVLNKLFTSVRTDLQTDARTSDYHKCLKKPWFRPIQTTIDAKCNGDIASGKIMKIKSLICCNKAIMSRSKIPEI